MNGTKFNFLSGAFLLASSISRFLSERKAFERNDAYFQPNYFKHHIEPMCGSGGNVVHFLIYTDEFEVVNPIGVARLKHKLLTVYFKVLNFHPRHRPTSDLKVFHLVLLIKSSTVKALGLDEVSSPLINELNFLFFSGVIVGCEIYHAIVNCVGSDIAVSNFIVGFTHFLFRVGNSVVFTKLKARTYFCSGFTFFRPTNSCTCICRIGCF